MQIWKLDLYHNTRIFILHNTNYSFFLKIYYLSLSFFRSLLNHLQVDFLNDCPSVIWYFPKVLLGLIRHHPCSACSSSSPPIARASDLFIHTHFSFWLWQAITQTNLYLLDMIRLNISELVEMFRIIIDLPFHDTLDFRVGWVVVKPKDVTKFSFLHRFLWNESRSSR